jgi:hypothetical protein
MPRSREFCTLVDVEIQEKAGVSIGDKVGVSVQPLETDE